VERSGAYTLPTTTYFLDSSYPMSMANVTGVASVPAGSLVARPAGAPYAIQTTATPGVQAGRAAIATSTPQQVHGKFLPVSPNVTVTEFSSRPIRKSIGIT